MCGGQFLDMLGEGNILSLEELDEINSRKTGALLTAACLKGAGKTDRLRSTRAEEYIYGAFGRGALCGHGGEADIPRKSCSVRLLHRLRFPLRARRLSGCAPELMGTDRGSS